MKYLFLLLLIACAKEPVSVSQTTNSEINVGLLFENDGCRVYRFWDGGQRVYYTNCDSTSWDETHQCGKTQCTDHHRTTTNRRKK